MTVAQLFPLGVSAIALVVSVWVAISSRQRDAATLEGTLQAQYNQLRTTMNDSYHDPNWIPLKTNVPDWRPFVAYWAFCYSEYELTAKSPYAAHRRLWKRKFRTRVAAGLSYPALRHVLVTMVQDGAMSTGYADEFLAELKAIHGSDLLRVADGGRLG